MNTAERRGQGSAAARGQTSGGDPSLGVGGAQSPPAAEAGWPAHSEPAPPGVATLPRSAELRRAPRTEGGGSKRETRQFPDQRGM